MSTRTGESTRFIGRRHELSEIRNLLSTSRVVTLTGIGGTGKTRIARRLSADLARSHKDGVWMVELADLQDPDLLGHTVAGALGLQLQTGEWDIARLTGFLDGRHALLILDNCEHLNVQCAELVVGLIEACPNLKVLTTSRMPLGVTAEAVFQVPPMSVPDAEHLPPVEAFGQYESVTLFLDRATESLPSFQLTTENAESVARLVSALDGVPLALELAAARIRVLTPEAMLGRLSDRYHLLSRGYRDAPARQQSLMASVDWTFELCTPEEQTLWARLSVFTGGFDLDAAESVCSGDGLDQRDILDLVASLLDKSVLTRDDGASARYRMLETIRQYGAAKLDEAGELDRWRHRHRDWYSELVHQWYREWLGPDQARWVQRLTDDHPNLRAALECAVRDPDSAPIALRMCHLLEQYWICRGLISEARHWCELGLAHGTGTVAERTLAFRLCAYFATLQMDLGYAERMLERAYEVGGDNEDPLVQGYLHFGSGTFTTYSGRVERGIPHLLAGIEAFRRSGNLVAESHLTFITGMILGFAQEFERAAEKHRECIAILDPRGEVFMRSWCDWALGLDALQALDLPGATELEHKSLRLKWPVKDMMGIAVDFEALSYVAAAEDRGERAAALLGAADAIFQVIGMDVASVPYISEQRQAGLELAQATLSTQAFDRAFARGAALPLEEAMSFALEEVIEVPRATTKQESPLTKREEEVALLIGEGLSNKDIAARLVISQRTAQGHVENILRKLGFNSRTQVAAWVAERNAGDTTRRHLRAVGDN